eukprot:CAMPEP_0177334854 /NCGR_PEP_ID=MMETSP0368-20130122/22944_1 /TAXON_ID=447022 ORGANISM="Scrippsiella hangoei-like, Strain SHHI-4" /NCGR_SAMPLE_ID=MMETSP0368 /ASSEMBLY_ACC=CAM_ASM_000363 /LENGTH=331 /DNA_ID=CAMNT_0018795607 /DNA_START=40 /DNA_END=1035 /DNA_ORIENTATION=-
MKPLLCLSLLCGGAPALGAQLRAARQAPEEPDGISPDAQRALQRVAAVEDLRTSSVLCRVGASGGFGSVTVRLHSDNSRSVAFNGDVSGYETKVRCHGEPDPQCTNATISRDAGSVEECPACPCEEADGGLSGPYSREVAAEIDSRCSQDASASPRVLLLGLGCGELATHVARRCEGLQVDAVELDGRLPALARQYFGLPDRVQVTVSDALLVVLAAQQDVERDQLLADGKKYDVIFVDCFSDGGETPEHCRSPPFLQALHAIVRGGGKVIQHLWHTDPQHPQVAGQFEGTFGLYRKEFSCHDCKVETRAVGLGSVDSLVLVSMPAAASQA